MFLTGLAFLSILASVNLLSCISMNNQKCKVRTKIVNVNGDDALLFPFSIKTSKCSGSCNNINNPCAKSCFPDVAKNLNVKVFNLVWGTRRIVWNETCKCICRCKSRVCKNKKRWNDDKCRCDCKELIDKCVCDKGFIWNPRNCEYECYKSCDFSEFSDYTYCEYKKGLVNTLVECSSAEECTENIEETRLVEINSTESNSVENKYKRNSFTLYIVLFSITFTANVGIGSYFLFFSLVLKKDVTLVNNLVNL